VPTFPLMDNVLCWHSTILWSSFKFCEKIIMGLRKKHYIVLGLLT
jgi:hypothetical protein